VWGRERLGLCCWLQVDGEKPMESKPAQNIQDSFLNTARKDKSVITIYLLSGVKLTGRIRSFDKYSVVLETNNQEQLIFKHAISTVVMSSIPHAERHVEPRPSMEAAPVAANASSTSED
jgi:host factor-I protein